MDEVTRNSPKNSLIRRRRLVVATAALSGVIALSGSPVAAADPSAGGESGAVTGAGFGPTLGVGGPSSYTGGGTSTQCQHNCSTATVGVGGPSSYTGGTTANHPGGTATQGVGDVNSYTGQATSGTAHNATNPTTRTGNFGPGHRHP
ncbi:hypothetical protein [Mycolicibacterium sarraceniae]|uniref:Uncharacterized protein n=1 Tax=Mycolicibacterium sarraceniae TaxID=1534348 RepID=A0A7I7SLC2_9MYCO|nr:hypothetical protein [Mycolicibacterium sarraceniae]BBY57191.1 hypothetical protein MSAR_03270 [Mycolicibacterium sarraceniae]